MKDHLADKEFWDSRHSNYIEEMAGKAGAERVGLRRWLDGFRTRIGASPQQPYPEFLIEKLLLAHLPAHDDWKAIEVGCAPGTNLMRLNRLFGYQPYGVEYSSIGAETTRKLFQEHGFDTDNVIESDFLATDFQDQYHEHFDIVFSSGFIEHFEDLNPIISAHVSILKPGGYLVCTIPNLRSFALPYLFCFGRDLLNAHNLGIMRRRPYRLLFDNVGLESRFCDRIGVFQLFGVQLRHESSLRGLLARVMDRAGDAVSHLMYACLRGRAIESPWSPHLAYIGRKHGEQSPRTDAASPVAH